MAIFTLNEHGGRDELVDLCLRQRDGQRRFTRIEAERGRVELVIVLNGRYEAQFDATPEEALRVAEALVAAAEDAEWQRGQMAAEEARRKAEAERAQAERRGKRKKSA